MAKNSIDAYGAAGKTNLLVFKPEDLTLVTDPGHPLYDQRVNDPVSEEFILNVKTHGVIEPIVVWKDPESGKTLVVAGRNRTKGCLEANKRLRAEGAMEHLVPAITRRGSAEQMAAIMVIENELRRDDTPLRRAEKMARLQSYNIPEADLANIFGCTIPTVKRTLALLEQPAAVRKAVEAGEITLEIASKLAKFEAPEQREKLAEILAGSVGKKGHAKSRAQRKVVGAVPRVRSRREIEAILPTCYGEAALALQWALGGTDASFAQALTGAQA